ncbi:MAG: hypothetical protein EOM24_04655 [Chloroflexia bacterium]|nr:hypothetical protein [Chloroflexia bacterium]
MQQAIRVTTIVRPDGTLALSAPQLVPGEAVEVIILFPEHPDSLRRSAVDILRDAPGQRAFATAEDVTTYLSEERDAWER